MEGCRRKGKPDLIGHSGGTWSFRSFAAMLPELEIAVVVLANTARSVHRLGFELLELLQPLTAHHAFVTEA